MANEQLIQVVRAAVREELKGVREDVRTDISAAETRINANVAEQVSSAETRINANVAEQVSSAETRINANVTEKISAAETQINQRMDDGFARVQKDTGDILVNQRYVMDHTDRRLNDHEERITHLEKAVIHH